MIVLDTNVISELMKEEPDPMVLKWTNALPWNSIFTTAVAKAELLYGTAILPAGKRRAKLDQANAKLFETGLNGRVLDFNSDTAEHFADIRARRRRLGREIKFPDAMIAAICAQNRFAIATRNVDDFTDCGIEIIDPWAG